MKPHHHVAAKSTHVPSNRQRLYTRYAIAILVDLAVLNLFAEYWQHVHLDSFSVSLAAAALLQLLLQATLSLEHWVAGKFEGREGSGWKALRILSAWTILFASKFVMLGAIDRVFGEAVHFSGTLHGVVALITVLVAMIAAEAAFVWGYRRLG